MSRRVTKGRFRPRIGNEDSRSDAPPNRGGGFLGFFGIGLFEHPPPLLWAFALGGHFDGGYLASFSLDQRPNADPTDCRLGVDQSSHRHLLYDSGYVWGSGGGAVGEAGIATDAGLFQGGATPTALMVTGVSLWEDTFSKVGKCGARSHAASAGLESVAKTGGNEVGADGGKDWSRAFGIRIQSDYLRIFLCVWGNINSVKPANAGKAFRSSWRRVAGSFGQNDSKRDAGGSGYGGAAGGFDVCWFFVSRGSASGLARFCRILFCQPSIVLRNRVGSGGDLAFYGGENRLGDF